MIKRVCPDDPFEEKLVFSVDLNLFQIIDDLVGKGVFVTDIVIQADSAVAVVFQRAEVA